MVRGKVSGLIGNLKFGRFRPLLFYWRNRTKLFNMTKDKAPAPVTIVGSDKPTPTQYPARFAVSTTSTSSATGEIVVIRAIPMPDGSKLRLIDKEIFERALKASEKAK